MIKGFSLPIMYILELEVDTSNNYVGVFLVKIAPILEKKTTTIFSHYHRSYISVKF